MSIKVSKTCLKNAQANSENFGYVGPSEVRALSVRRCRRAAWQTKWPLLTVLFSLSSSFILLPLLCSDFYLTLGADFRCANSPLIVELKSVKFRVLVCADTGARTPLGVRQYLFLMFIGQALGAFELTVFTFWSDYLAINYKVDSLELDLLRVS
jgi:hypothetical protein